MGSGDPAVDLAARLADTARRDPDGTALVWQTRRVSYAELDRRATAAAAGLQHLGVEPGDRVAIVLGNVPAFVEAHFGALRAGAAVVPTNPELARPELGHVLADSGARVCVVGAPRAAEVASLRAGLPDLEHVVVVGGSAPHGVDTTWDEVAEADRELRPAERGPDDLAALVYTSGTTGRPRGAMLSRRNLAANQDQSLAGRFRVEPTDTVLLVLPLSHIYALNVGLGACVRVGATMLLVERFDPASTLDLIEQHEVSVILGAPTMYVAWANLPDAAEHDLRSVRIAVSGAAPLPPAVLGRFQHQFEVPIWEGYGLTEAAPSVASNVMGDAPRPGSVGLPLPDVEVRLVDETGADVVPGDPGEVWVRGPNVFQGYWNDPEATAAALTPEGWLRTGDIATRDADGYLYLVDRRRDLIIVSGFNVYPREVERVLQTHPGVAECAVVGTPHPYTGEAVRAFVVPQPDAQPTDEELDAHCRRSLARYKCPERFELVDALPHTASGKVRRVALRDDA